MTSATADQPGPVSRRQISGGLFTACGVWLIALGVYFVLLRPALLPEDPRFMGSSLESLRAAAPGLERWLNLVFNVMGGFMVATGALTMLLAWCYLASRARGTLIAMVLAGAASVALMSATNFVLASDFRWLLLAPVLLWVVALGAYVREGARFGLVATTGRQLGERRFFHDQAFHFQTLRALNNVRSDGAETGEVLEIIANIRQGDTASWYHAWEAAARCIILQAARIADARSRGQSLLRAHNYLRTAEFFLAPSDPKRASTFRRNVDAFEAGLDAMQVQRERTRIPYGQHYLNAIFYPGPAGAEPQQLLVLCGGFDSTLEELYFVLVPEAHDRGFDVLTFEGPGQGAVLREQKLTCTSEWELPTKAVLDAHFARHPPRGKTIMIGMSMGGYLAPRAAAFDRRIDGVVAYDVLYDFGAVARATVPAFALWLRARRWDALLSALIAAKIRLSTGFAWSVANGQWVLGTAGAMETLDALDSYTLALVAGRIRSDVLILVGADDHFIPTGQAESFARALTTARSVRTIIYERGSGGSAHCQMGAQSLWHADLFDWIAGIT